MDGVSLKLSGMTLEELVQVTQGLGHQIEKLRAQRAHVRTLIDQRLAEQRDAQQADAGAGAVVDGVTLKAGKRKVH